ncbi:MAG: M50 family metallopeptidase [Longimicrobiales bacterium]
MSPKAKRRALFLGGFLLYFGVIWTLWDTVIIFPLKIFVVLLHEVSHGAAAVATGGTVERILLDVHQGGAAYTRGGNGFIILSAGYLGSLLWGALFILLAFNRRLKPRWILAVVGASVLLLTLFLVRSLFGFVFGILFAAGLMAGARYLSQGVNRALLLGLGLTSALYAVLDIKSDILDRPHLSSDAAMLAEMTGVPTAVWGFLWIGIALLVCAWLLKWVARRMESRPAP